MVTWAKMRQNYRMDKKMTQRYTTWINGVAQNRWLEYCEIFPVLVAYDCPQIILNNRFTKTAGCCYQETNIIHISTKFLLAHETEMLRTILPHELAHQIDWNLYGLSEKKCGHGKNWQIIMVELGLAPNKYHSLVL